MNCWRAASRSGERLNCRSMWVSGEEAGNAPFSLAALASGRVLPPKTMYFDGLIVVTIICCGYPLGAAEAIAATSNEPAHESVVRLRFISHPFICSRIEIIAVV